MTGLDRHYGTRDLINLETKPEQDRLALRDQKERLVIGHNVSYDRARIKEQYFIEGTKLRFLDTMSMHIAVSGITSYQRTVLMAGKKGTALPNKTSSFKPGGWRTEEILEWQNVSSCNGLNDVYKLYCGGAELDKEKRSIFVTGSLFEIKEDFQQLVTYCARDTLATYRVLANLYPQYQSRFPHPVTVKLTKNLLVLLLANYYFNLIIDGRNAGNGFSLSTSESQLAALPSRLGGCLS